MFIVLEGIDGAGKGRQRNEISSLLAPKISKLHSMEFPDHEGILYRNLIKPALLEKIKLSGKAMFLSFALDQLLHQPEITKAQGSAKESFICDGYYTTNLVYNILVNKIFTLEQALSFAKEFGIAAPDLNVFIDVKPEIALQRKLAEEGHDEGLDIYERDLKKQQQLRAAYLKLSKTDAFGPWAVIDGNGTIPEVTHNIVEVLANYKMI